MRLSLKYRELLNGIGTQLPNEFDQLLASLKGSWRVEHTEEDGHGNVTAYSLSLIKNPATSPPQTGVLTVEGDGNFNGNVTADADGTPVVIGTDTGLGPGIAMRSPTAKWRWAALGGAARNLVLRDELATDASALEIQATNIGASIDYTLMPHSASTRWFLGQDASNQRWIEVSALAVKTRAVTFPATQVDSADANTLDDYEEGTWTPTIVSSAGGTPTYTQQVGIYTKIGNKVYLHGRIILATKGSLAAGNAQIGGLPFNCGTSPNPVMNIGYFNSSTTAVAEWSGYGGGAVINLVHTAGGGGVARLVSAIADLGATQDFIFEMTYLL